MAGGVGLLSILAFQHVPTIAANTFVGPIGVGGLTREEASKRLRLWWETQKTQPLPLEAPALGSIPPMKPGELGFTLDDAASVEKIPLQDFWSDSGESIGIKSGDRADYPLLLKPNGLKPLALLARVRSASKVKPATVRYSKGQIIRTPEGVGLDLKVDELPDAVATAVRENVPVVVPLTAAPKKITDEALASIEDVVATYTTPYSAAKRDRSVNLKTASSKINGVVLLPGERFSFNQTVGPRSIENGFREAIVFEEGRQTPGVGGGICQVSSTLYNAALFANLKIVQRRNHSIPVPYVSLGRDATVYWGSVDLVLENNYPSPIAIVSEMTPGRLTFRILGKKDPSLAVKIESTNASSFGAVVQTVKDANLPAGVTRIREKGSVGRSIQTYRLVYRNGKLLERQPLGTSRYRGELRVVAVGTKQSAGSNGPSPAKPSGAVDQNLDGSTRTSSN